MAEAIPRGFATPELVSAILCAHAFSRAAAVPTDVAASVLERARSFIAG